MGQRGGTAGLAAVLSLIPRLLGQSGHLASTADVQFFVLFEKAPKTKSAFEAFRIIPARLPETPRPVKRVLDSKLPGDPFVLFANRRVSLGERITRQAIELTSLYSDKLKNAT